MTRGDGALLLGKSLGLFILAAWQAEPAKVFIIRIEVDAAFLYQHGDAVAGDLARQQGENLDLVEGLLRACRLRRGRCSADLEGGIL